MQGYPTIKYFPAGTKGDAEEYDGGRTADDIVKWAESRDAIRCCREIHISFLIFHNIDLSYSILAQFLSNLLPGFTIEIAAVKSHITE